MQQSKQQGGVVLDRNAQIKMCAWMTCAETNQDTWAALMPTRNKRQRELAKRNEKCKHGFANTEETYSDILREIPDC